MNLPNLPPLTLGGSAGPSGSPLSGHSGFFDGSGWSVNFSGNQAATGTGSAPTAAKALSGIPAVLLFAGMAFLVWKLIK